MKTILLMDIVIVFVGIYLAVSAAKMKKILREFNTGKKYSQVAISFKNNKVDCIELSARV